MKTSIATVSLSGDLRDKLEAIAAAGFDGVEIFENDFLSFDAGARDVGKMVADVGLEVTLFQPFRDFEGMPEPQRQRAFDRIERKFDVMQALGTDLMLVCSNVSPQSLGGIDRAAADFQELGERAANRGLRIGYEALAWGRHISDHRDAWEIVRRADQANVGLILDSFHTLSRDIPVDGISSIPKDRIFLVQLADAPRLDMDLLSWSRHFRSMPGQGDLAVADFAEAVCATGYDGVISLEIFNDQFRAGSARTVAVDGQRSLVHLLDRIQDRGETEIPGRTRLPPPARCLDFEFLEFAVDDDTAASLAALFTTLGFAKTGQHRNKEVTWWRQGDINLVINAEKEGFAHTSYIMHGPSVCAMGLRVEDAGQTAKRARSLLAQPFSQPVGPGELVIPAIRGVGGSLIYFTDPKGPLAGVWETEFETADESGAAGDGIGLLSVDHVSQSMGYEEMLSWLLFYTAIFDMTKTPELDIADPAGLVRSQVVRNADGAVRIALNGSQSHRTLSARFLSEFFGSGVQHIAFSTGDIFDTARRLKANGMTFLPISGNYYDDLEARFALDAKTIEALRGNNILFDRDETGEYFQIYTPSFADRFFFEIVERRTYEGFGAVNAPIRLAAQTKLAGTPGVPRQ